MTQSFTLRESDSELAPEAVFTSPNMMPPWKQSDVAFNLDVLEKPGQKRRRSFLQQDPFNVYSESHNMLNERVSTDSVQLSNLEPNPGGNIMFGGLDSSAFPSERRGFYSRALESSSCGIFPFRAPEVVEHSANSSVFLGSNNADYFGARNQQRPLDSATAMANFQALFDQGRSSSSAGFQAYNGSNGTQTSTLPSIQHQTPSFTPLREQQQQQQQQELHSIHGFSLNPSFGLPTTTSSGFNYFSGFQDTNSLAFGDPAATGVNGAYAANAETAWPNLTCNTSMRNPSHSTLFPDPPSPCTPRGHSVLLTDAQEEYLQHMERLNSEAVHDSPPPRGRRLSYNPPPLPDERFSRGNNSYMFHPFELDQHAGFQEKHLHVYFDESGIPRHVDVEDSAPTTVTQVDESAAVSGTRGIAPEDFGSQEETYSLSFNPPQAAVAGGEKEISRSNADQFDLNEVPVSVGEATPPKPRKKYHPRVAKDKRTYKRRADGKKGPANAVAGFANTDFPVKKSAKKRGGHQATQYDSTTEEGRDSSYPEVVDMDIEDMTTAGVTAPHTAQHDTTVCDCEACIKLRLERRHSTVAGLDSTFASFDGMPQSPVSPRGHSPDSSSNSPSVRRTLFQASPAPEFDHTSNGAPAARRLPLAFDDSSLEQANATVLSQLNSTTRRLPLAFDDSSSEQANAAVLSLANSTARRLPPAFDDSRSEQANAAQANSTVRRMPLAFDDSSSEQANAVVLSLANSTARRLPPSFDDSSPEQANAMVLSQANSTAYANVRSFVNSSRVSCLQQFNESATQLGFSWDGKQQQQQQQGDVAKPANSFDWNPPLTQRAPSTTSSTFMSRLCPRGILSPQQIPFREMNAIQRVVYLKSILSSNPQLKMSPESLLRHVHDHLPEDEKAEFQSSLWPIILKNLTDEQMKQLEDYAHAEQQQVGEAAPRAKEVAVTKRKPGPKPKKKELAMTLWPNLVESKANTNKPGRGRRPKKTIEDAPQNHGMEMVPYETNNNNNNNNSNSISISNSNEDKAMVPYEQNKAVVAYEGPFNPLRKKKARPKVVLDGETVRVWKLLMGKPASAGAENVPDAENALKWEDERRKMKAQALLFIERMHIVQGDRSFSCWKGSVVDSVVGAFLTQNVNDVLSSSAFMSMRSRFPGRGFRSSPLQTKNPESFETVAASFESPPSPAPQISDPSSQNIAPECPPSSITVLESQESRNEEPNYDHLHIESATNNNTSWNQNHEESAASTVSEISNQPEDTNSFLPQSHLSASSLSELTNLPEETNPLPPQSEQSKTSNSQSENSSGLEYQMVPEELSSGVNTNNQVEVVVSSENEISRELSTEGSAALVEANHEPSHGKYNPKTGLTGLERAKIEEKQVTARKSFDFSGLNEEFKPRIAGEERPPGPPRTETTEDGVDWEAVRAANVQEVADVIKERGLNWILAGRIKAFLERIHLDYGALDLEWLRSMSTDQTKEFLLSIRGLGLKSVECIRLLTLHHLAFPVDTNVGRICVRLGWVPLEPLPEELQLHLLELYPVQATIQKYLWPRLCKLDQQTLYELHYQMITFGKVFCTKSKPNCNACPMRPECKHFASALSSAKLALPAAERPNNGPTLALPPGTEQPGTEQDAPQERVPEPPRPVSQYCQPIVEEPMTPESEADLEEFDIEDYPFTVEEVEDDGDMNICIQDPQAPSTQLVQQSASIDNPNCSSILSITDSYVTISEPEPASEPASHPAPTLMEDWGGLATSGNNSVQLAVDRHESGCCPTSVIKIVESICEEVLDLDRSVNKNNSNPTTNHHHNPHSNPHNNPHNNNHPDNPGEVLIHPNSAFSHEMVLVPPGAASLPVPKLKNVGRLRTVHYVYELPDNHPLLDGLDPREHDDPCTYLLAIWSPGEVPESIPNMNDTSHEENPFAASSSDGEESIKATLLVPCRTAMHGSFPLNGTYFQVNEVFADHASSLQPMIVPRTLLWNLRRRFVFFGTSVTSIFRGMTVEEIQACFWRGYVCVRGFDRATRAPKPLVGRLHLQAGKSSGKGANAES